MNKGILLFLGVFLTFASAWLGLVFAPAAQLADLKPMANPRPYTELEWQGRQVYMAEGCVYCHTQQVRGGTYLSDIQRDMGPRRSHPQDYVHDSPVLLGTMRTGPDLTNVGVRLPDEKWHHIHLYNPQRLKRFSIMSPYRHLYAVRKIEGGPSPDALEFDSRWTAKDGRPPAGFEVVPTSRAKALAAYLISLDRTYDLEGTKP